MSKKTSSSPQPIKIVISRLINSQWLIVSFIIFLIIIFSSYFSGRNQIISQQQSTLLFAKSASAYFQNAVNLVRTLAATSPSQADLEVVYESSKLIDSLYIINPDGHLSAIAPDNSQIKIGMDMSGHSNFQNGLNSYIQSKPFISPRTGNPTVYLSYPFENGAGLLVGELNLTGFEDNLIVMNLSKGINFYLTDASGVFLSHSNFEMVKQQQNIGYLNHFTNSSEEIESHVVRDHGKIKYSIVTKIPQTDWYAITETPILSIYGVIFYPAIFGLLLIGLIFLFIVRREREMIIKQVVNPISELDRLALSISQGKFVKSDLEDVSSGFSEIDTLAASFEFMRQAIENHTEELRKSEEKYRTVADFTYDWEAWRQPDGTFRYVSPSCERISGYKAAEFLKKPELLFEIVVPEDKLIFKEHLEADEHDTSESSVHIDFRIQDIHGNIHWISHWCAAVFGDDGEYIGRRESNRDITDRIEKEQELKKWGQVFANAEWGIVVGSADGKTTELMNPAFARMHGFEPGENIKMPIADYFAPECRDEIAENIELAHQKGHHVWECDHLHKDGHTFPVIMDVTTVKDEKGNIKYRVVNTQDVTEKRKIENELRQSEIKFSTAFRTSPDSININRLSDGMYIEINDGFTQLTGFTREDVNGKSSLDIDIWVNPDDRKRLVKGLREEGLVSNLEAQFRTKTGEIKSCLMSARVIEVNNESCILSITRDLTDRILAEKRVRESEEKFAKVFHEAPVWISITDLETAQYLEVNDEALQATGYTLDEVIGHSAEEIGVYEPGARKKIIDEINLNGRVVDSEMTFRAKDGKLLWGILNAESLVVNGKKCLLTIVNDITSRKQAEESARESAEFFKASFESANIGACIVGKNSEFLNVNDEYCRIVGYSRSELLKLTFNEITHPEDRNIGLDIHKKMQTGETNQGVFEKRYVHKSGTIVWVRISNAGVHDAEGELMYVVGYVQDITERKRLEEEIIKSEQKSRLLISQMHQGLAVHEIVLDEKGVPVDYRFLDINKSFERITGLKAENIIGKTVLEVLPGTEKSWIEKYGRVAITGEPIEFEDYHEEIGRYYGVVAYSPQPNQFAVIVSDITERKQSEKKINEQIEELRRWYSGMLGREKRTIELKNEVNQLLISEGKPPRYRTSNETKEDAK
jgi:PAS domain S-box-containing protein